MPLQLQRAIHFSHFVVTSQVFHTTRSSFATVNIKPLIPGHSLVCPLRVVSRLSELSPDEVSDLFQTVQRVGNMLSRVFKSDALNIAVQDGAAAGQSVPHVHVHIIPRHKADLEHNDDIYPMMENNDVGGALKAAQSRFPADSERLPRSQEEMNKEAAWLAEEMDKS